MIVVAAALLLLATLFAAWWRVDELDRARRRHPSSADPPVHVRRVPPRDSGG